MKRLLAFVLVLMFAFLPASAAAQSPDGGEEGLILRIRGDVVIGDGERISSVVVIDGNLTVDGEITDFALVIDGNALINGSVSGDLTVISGDIELTSGAVVKNVNSIRGDFVRAAGAQVTGDVNERDNFQFFWAVAGLFSILFWLGMTLALVVAALVFAAFGGRQLTHAATGMTGDLVNTIIGAVAVWVALPMLAVLALITVIGIPLGLGILLVLLPALGFLGYIVAGTRLGRSLLRAGGRESAGKPYLEAALGVLVLQFVLLVPVIGAFLALLAGVWGAGALAFVIYRGAGGKGFESDAPPAPAASPVEEEV